MSFESIPARLRAQGKAIPTALALAVKRSGEWKKWNFAEYAGLVRRAGKALQVLGLGKGSTVCILGFNRPEWVILDVGAMSIGAAPAGIYTTSSPEECRYIIGHAEAPVVLVENDAQLKKIQAVWDKLPALKYVVMMEGATPPADEPRVLSWEGFLQKGDAGSDEAFDKAVDAIAPEELATLIYTSGTTGPPKGVMLSHKNLAWTAAAARDLVGGEDADRSLSYLPLSHIAEQMFSVHGPITMGSSVWFAESIDKVADNLKEVEPTVFFGVPRIWEKMHAGITAKMRLATGFKKILVDNAVKVGAKASEAKNRGTELGLLDGLLYALFNKLVFTKLKAAIGLGKARICVSGAAPIGRDVLEFFASLDLQVLEVYGQSEDTGPTSFNQPGRTKLGTVGPAIPGVEVKIAEDGEILVKGPNVFLGYYKEPQATAETLKDGWLCSGDLGEFDKEGFLKITGRKKEIIITAGGKNISPKNIEEAIKVNRLVAEAVVIGDRRKFLSALIALDPDATVAWAKEQNLGETDFAKLCTHKAVLDEIQVEKIKKFTILERPLGIDTGELTPTLKVKRKIVNQNFAPQIEAMYTE